MARIRTVKPEFFTSPDTAQLDFPVRIFYQALWCWADDFGVGETNLNGLLGFAFPDTDNFTAQDVRRFCADLARIVRVNFYTVRGRHYYAIPSWDEHQKTERRGNRRRHPAPDDPEAMPDQRIYGCADSAPDMPRKNGANPRKSPIGTGEQGNRGTGEQGNSDLAAQAQPPQKRATRIAADWMPDPPVIEAMRAERPDVDLEAEHRKFIDYWLGKSGRDATKADWNATWRNWIRNARQPARNGTPLVGADRKAADWMELAERIDNQPNGKAIGQ